MLSGIKFIPRDQIDEKSNYGRRGKTPSYDEGRSCGGSKKKGKMDGAKANFHDGYGVPHAARTRKEMGLEWMLKPKSNLERDTQPDEEPPAQELKRAKPRELNPYYKDGGSGFPEDTDVPKTGGNQLLSSSVVGDGGASWRLKALKRSQEQAASEGRKFDEVVGERWGSLGQLTVSVASHKAAPSSSHLHAIKNRRKELSAEQQTLADDDRVTEKRMGQECPRDASVRRPQMRVPKLHDSLSWGQQKSQNMSNKDAGLVSSAMSSINKFADDGSFTREVMSQQNEEVGHSLHSSYSKCKKDLDLELVELESQMKGRHEEADKLLDEERPRKKSRISTQVERCKFCFENPRRLHLVVAIGNFTYLTLPPWQPIVPGHCCILPMQHESATRSVDNNVWEEIRNFKKCLIMMFDKQEKDVVFLETVMGLAQQRRHCLVECIPLPKEISKQAPLYFKKAIDEAEDEWSIHDAKKLIDTSRRGLRGSIPKDFPYFHVEFGLDKGFVHVIDDEIQFKTSFGHNIIRGMLELPEEDTWRRKYDSVEKQKLSVATFLNNWQPFDWTKQLE